MEGTQKTIKPPGSYFMPLFYSMAGVVSVTILLVAYHLILVKYCRGRRVNNNTRSAGNNGVLRRGGSTMMLQDQMEGVRTNYGVEKKVLEAIPILSYSSKNEGLMFRVDDHQSECVVCLGELEDGDVVRLLPNCRHVFHVSCIDEWFLGHTSCPICRSLIIPIVSKASGGGGSGGDSVIVPLDDEIREGDHPTVDILTCQQEIEGSSSRGGGGGERSNGGLRHCVSFALPMEEKQKRLIRGLKRSLSLDQSYIIVNMQKERRQNVLSSSSSSSSIKSLRSITQLDRVSSMLARSFSLIRLGKNSPNNGAILPL